MRFGGGGRNVTHFIFGTGFGSGGNNARRFVPPFGSNGLGVIGNQQHLITRDWVLTRFQVCTSTNTKDADGEVGFSDDGVDIEPITIPFGVSGRIDSGVISARIIAESLVTLYKDFTGSTLGSWGGSLLWEANT